MAKVYMQDQQLAELLALADAFVDDEIIPEVIDDMKKLAPVDTGELRDSIEPGGKNRINIGAKHAAHVEFGTEHMAAQPFVRPALYRRR